MNGDSSQPLLDQLFARVNYERQPWPAREGLKLELIGELVHRLGDPHRMFPVIHIAGTKGKGSTTRLVADIFQAAGYRAATYTSPHLESFHERFCINGNPVSGSEMNAALEIIWPHVLEMDRFASETGRRKLTFFDVSTALGFLIFSRAAPDVVVLETGLGGRLDSTNVCHPAVTVITSISLDHCRQLGTNVVDIAAEKAGIVKKGIPLVCGIGPASPAASKVHEVAAGLQSPILQIKRDFSCDRIYLLPGSTRFSTAGSTHTGRSYEYPDVELAWFGEHSAWNAAIAIAAANAFRDVHGLDFTEQDVRTACLRPALPGRIEVLSKEPLVVLDVAHNPASAAALAVTLQGQLSGWQRAGLRNMLVAISRDKDQREIIRQLLPCADRIVFTQFLDNPRATDPLVLAEMACDLAQETMTTSQTALRIDVAADPVGAWMGIASELRAGDAVCITGSIFLVAELRRLAQSAFAKKTALDPIDNS